MEAVVTFGTGASLAPLGFAVAMKTGTAAEPGQGYHVNYIGAGPLPDPRSPSASASRTSAARPR
jgi:cell division protein FtsI/penicillin-binding protein 2